MTTSLRLCCCFSRRHFARISISDMLGESSMKSGDSEIWPMIRASFCHPGSPSVPLRRSCSWICASADSTRIVISVRLISREKIAVACLCRIAAARAMSRPMVDLPTAGRAAMTIIWPGCRPWVSSSSSMNPVGTPIISSVRPEATSISFRVSSSTSPRAV